MSVVVVGASYRTAPIAVRERLAIANDQRAEILARIRARDAAVREAMIVSTCNRVEIYAEVDGHAVPHHGLADALCARASFEEVRPHLYERIDAEAIRHIFRVAASLDSLVLGEPQILGQLKEAFDAASAAETIGARLSKTLQRAFFVGKRVRTETALGEGQVSVASVAVDLTKRLFDTLADREVLLLGAGEIAESAARSLLAAGASRVRIANRSRDKAEALAQAVDPECRFASTHPIDELPKLLETADVVLVSTGAPTYVVTRELAATALKRRRGRPIFFIDLAVPRNVDPVVHSLDGCYRYDLDDLEKTIVVSGERRRTEAARAEAIVAEEARTFGEWVRQQSVTPTIVALRARFRGTLTTELQRSFTGRLRHLRDEDRQQLALMVDAAVNKLLHAPTRALKATVEAETDGGLVDARARARDTTGAGCADQRQARSRGRRRRTAAGSRVGEPRLKFERGRRDSRERGGATVHGHRSLNGASTSQRSPMMQPASVRAAERRPSRTRGTTRVDRDASRALHAHGRRTSRSDRPRIGRGARRARDGSPRRRA